MDVPAPVCDETPEPFVYTNPPLVEKLEKVRAGITTVPVNVGEAIGA